MEMTTSGGTYAAQSADTPDIDIVGTIRTAAQFRDECIKARTQALFGNLPSETPQEEIAAIIAELDDARVMEPSNGPYSLMLTGSRVGLAVCLGVLR